MVDLRSDTVSLPTPEMAEAIMAVIPHGLGDDVYGEDPTVLKLQQKCCNLTGKEAALFVTSGCMANQLAIKSHSVPGNEVIVESESHILHYETAVPSIISGVQLMPVNGSNGEPDLSELERKIRPKEYYYPQTSLVCLENTHNRSGGAIISITHIEKLRKLCNDYSIKMHLDGARIFNAIAETGIDLKKYSSYFDSISFCFSKGLGAPVGSVLCGNTAFIATARKWRKILGGGMRQSGILAAAAIYAVDNNITRLKDDNLRAKHFANGLLELSGMIVKEPQTNIVLFKSEKFENSDLIQRCKSHGILISSGGNDNIRAVFHLGINDDDLSFALSVFKKICLNN
ncbi:MAG: aminotransferase class I/II-fold pyridoxal phosphate-dependent enzyme [Ignavibacteriaceae bacterium]|nr:aminotransferase class I/II-fold pyridoxal phosphate-dependent enzyme [Ignavibacteriaceae bacterium]